MEALGINLGYLLVQVLNFLILFIILRAWVFIPIMGVLDKRRATIAQGLEDARIAAEARANAEEEAKKILNNAQIEAAEKIKDASQRAEAAGLEMKNDAEAESAKIREQGKADAVLERERILGDMRSQVAALAIAATQKLIGEVMDEKRQRELIDQFFSGVKTGKVVVLQDTEIKATSAEIISALPLTDAEKDIVKSEITTKVGAQTVAFRVDPNILGGLVVKVGDKVLDGSVAGHLESLRERLV